MQGLCAPMNWCAGSRRGRCRGYLKPPMLGIMALMKLDSDKPRPNTVLIILTMFDLIAAAAGAMSSLITRGSDTAGQSNFPIIMSVPITAVILVIVAWVLESTDHPKKARLIAAVPLLWGMTVLVVVGNPI